MSTQFLQFPSFNTPPSPGWEGQPGIHSPSGLGVGTELKNCVSPKPPAHLVWVAHSTKYKTGPSAVRPQNLFGTP